MMAMKLVKLRCPKQFIFRSRAFMCNNLINRDTSNQSKSIEQVNDSSEMGIIKPTEEEVYTPDTIITEDDNILVRQKKERKRVEQLTQYLNTKQMEELDKDTVIQMIRDTLPKKRGIRDAIKPYIRDYASLTEEEKESAITLYFDHTQLLKKMDLNMEQLRAIQDEDYYVDIEEEVK